MDELLLKGAAKAVPKVGELIEGTVITVSKNEVHLDIEGLTTGVVRGKEIYDESGEYSDVKPGDKVAATVLEIENENGEMELSFRFAGHQKAWDNLEDLLKSQETTEAKIIDANKGGLMVKVGNVLGFLPVSQLNIEHYPRVEGGDKSRILVALKRFAGQVFKVKVIDVNEGEEKLIVSEKAAWEQKQKQALNKYKIGDVVEGTITGVVDFGAFIEFGEEKDNLEGLIHISELAWQRIDDPKEIIKVGDKVKAEIISIENSKISLSIKKLSEDPWKDVEKKYPIGSQVKGKILKQNPFGAFVELDQDIHGLIHISELEGRKEKLEEGQEYDFYVISIDPKEHRLGLSFNKASEKKEGEVKPEKAEIETPAEEK
ncbi:MAG: 30S ribosomal protein S1 [Candidatus Komeilibacteria bacterium CG10_big_fil_rev_8_21_14_0_10_41_13]|uniref:30S ribosomal protein S1 n=1 Tax=Candidatus Komeilibacteria bacterium CG10_big_fil_rev_8_21_14_0_10_41_13 TaxID=1974476 RepID=A0A2M6WC35_9BACT|nr:MAG: 30S ribosomal protein S1 [Candidatus Komeilibacteria bacterium CG10_big_fil_rev_8_21_14_0_10_41_13]